MENEQIYDSVFWTAVVKMKKYFIPLVNEVFGEHFTSEATIRILPGKQTLEREDASFERGEVDSLAEFKTIPSMSCLKRI